MSSMSNTKLEILIVLEKDLLHSVIIVIGYIYVYIHTCTKNYAYPQQQISAVSLKIAINFGFSLLYFDSIRDFFAYNQNILCFILIKYFFLRYGQTKIKIKFLMFLLKITEFNNDNIKL